MAHYRLYFFDREFARINRVEEFEATDDLAACATAARLASGDPMELWRHEWKIQTFDRELALELSNHPPLQRVHS